MRFFRPWLALFIAVYAPLPTVDSAAQCRVGQRRVTVADAIEMTRLGVASYMDDSPSNPALFSPDGRRFALVLKKGDLQQNTNDYTLEVFNTRAALSLRGSEAVVRMASNSNREAIRGVKWLADRHTILFIGEMPNAIPQIYSYDVSSRRLERITYHSTPVVAFDASGDGRVIAFEADPPMKDRMASPEVERAGFHVTDEDLADILLSGSPYARYRSRASRQLFLLRRGRKPRRIQTEDGIWPNLTLSVAPSGRYALVESLVRDVPKSWLGYKDRLLHEFIAANKAPSAVSSVERYLLLDTRTGEIAPLIDAPKSWEHDGFLWIDEGNSLVLSRAYLPLTGISQAEQEQHAGTTFAIEVRLPSREIVKILDGNAKATRWLPPDREAIFEDGNGATEAYRKQGGAWEKVSGKPVKPHPTNPRATYEQDMNTPPRLWITDSNGKKRLLLDLNPQFKHLCFGVEREISWKATDGHTVRGGLYLPPDYQSGHRYPLVIQTHGFDPGRFWIDGPWASAFAAQPLAAQGIAVLQMGESDTDAADRSTPREAPRQMAAFEGAIDDLDREGIIDRERVGIIGFSRTVYHVAYTLTNSKSSFRAATLADGFNGGYFERIAYPNQAAEPDAVNGGPPYGPTLPLWMEHSPAFNIARVKTPIRLEGYGVAAAVEEWEWYSLLSAMKKPVDFILLPRAPHLLVKPWERMASEQGNVDWFVFWLKGEEDPSPGKRAQYARWRRLREFEAKDRGK